jgi:hypothetical protein
MEKNGKVKKADKKSKWVISEFEVLAGNTAEWIGPPSNSEFVVWFPSSNNPLVGSNEVFSDRGVAKAQVKPIGGIIQRHARFPYCILLLGADKDVVVGENSPPEMIIE